MSSLVAPVLDAPPLARYGYPTLEKGANPGNQTAFTQTVPGEFFVRILAISVRLTPDATAANRTLFVEYRDVEGVRTALAGANVTVPASDTTDFFLSAWLGQPDWEIASTVVAPLPPILLYPGMTWRIDVDSMQATDTLTRIRFWQERFYTTGPAPGIGAYGAS